MSFSRSFLYLVVSSSLGVVMWSFLSRIKSIADHFLAICNLQSELNKIITHIHLGRKRG